VEPKDQLFAPSDEHLLMGEDGRIIERESAVPLDKDGLEAPE
jgi:hypothetical protein